MVNVVDVTSDTHTLLKPAAARLTVGCRKISLLAGVEARKWLTTTDELPGAKVAPPWYDVKYPELFAIFLVTPVPPSNNEFV